MSRSEELHQQAMEFFDIAYYAEIKGKTELVQSNFRKAFELEKQAAMELFQEPDHDFTRAVIFRSAAAIALRIGEWRESERLACIVLAGNPPKYVLPQIREILQKATAELQKLETQELEKIKNS